MQTKPMLWLTLCWLVCSACDPDFGTKTSGQACTRSSQCAEGLRCREGACHSRRKPARAMAADAGAADAETSVDAGELPVNVRGQ